MTEDYADENIARHDMDSQAYNYSYIVEWDGGYILLDAEESGETDFNDILKQAFNKINGDRI